LCAQEQAKAKQIMPVGRTETEGAAGETLE
jgi:hypothetical protein